MPDNQLNEKDLITIAEWHELTKDNDNIAVKVKPKGGSMRPLIIGEKDQVVIYKLYRPLKVGDIVLFRRQDDMNVLHRLWKIEPDKLITYGDGCYSPDAPIDPEQVWGIAVKLFKGDKTYMIGGVASRFQGRIWWAYKFTKRFVRKAGHLVIREWLGIKPKTK